VITSATGVNVTTCTLTNCIQAVGGFQSTGSTGGFSVTSDTAPNSFQTVGGFNACLSSICSSGIAYEVAGIQIVSSARAATFVSVVATVFNSTAATSTIAFQTSSGSFQVDGYGDGSFGGSVNAAGNTSLGLAPYRVNGTTIVDSSRNLLNIAGITMSGILISTSAALFTSVGASSVIGSTGGYIANGSTGVSCSGAPGGSFASVLGIVTHC